MNKEIKQQWIDALRSGNYLQGKGCLTQIKDGKEYDCCLGVLCKVLKLEREETEMLLPGGYIEGYEYRDINSKREVYTLLPSLSKGIPVMTLQLLNDREGATFNEIADYIEKYL